MRALCSSGSKPARSVAVAFRRGGVLLRLAGSRKILHRCAGSQSRRRLAIADRYELAVLDGDDRHFLVRRAGLVREVCIPGHTGEAGDGKDGVVDRLRTQISRLVHRLDHQEIGRAHV